MTARRCAAILLLALILLGGCSRFEQIGREPPLTPPGRPVPAVVPPSAEAVPAPPLVIAGPRPMASLWQPVSLFSDRRARRVGDILTVVIEIDDRAQISNRTQRSRDGGETLDIGTIFGVEQEVDDLLPGNLSFSGGVDLESSSDARGDGTVTRDETIELKIAATVTDVLPNGNLVILGSQEIRVNYELRELQVTGIIRPEDIARNNTIPYDRIAEARVVYGGRGVVYQVQQPRYGQQILDVILPF